LKRGFLTNVSGEISGQAMDMRMELGLTGLRWRMQVDGGPRIAVRAGRILGFIPNGKIYHLDLDGSALVLSRPHDDAFEWPLDQADKRVGYLTVSVGWGPGTPLEMDVELAKELPSWMVGVVAYLACRAFVDSANPRMLRLSV
jgi:hypothetical protein